MAVTSYDAIVVGVGGIGSAAVEQLARRGLKVLGLDRFHPPHTQGSTYGGTRLIRKAYFEDTRYLPLLQRSYLGWQALSDRAGQALYVPCGFLVISEGDETDQGLSPVTRRMLAVGAEHGIVLEALDAKEVRRRFPQFQLPDSSRALFEPDAGYLPVERCVSARLEGAVKAGAELRFGERVTGWQARPGSVVVETERGRYEAGALVLTPGAWTPELLGDLELPLVVRRGPQFWFQGQPSHRPDAGMPCFAFSTASEFIYGFPALAGGGLKVASYTPSSVLADPLQRDPAYTAAELGPVARAVGRHLPGVETTPDSWSICMYTLTPDENFLLDTHPDHPNVHFFTGDSGHAFKFAPALGEVLAAWVAGEAAAVDVDFLRRRPFPL